VNYFIGWDVGGWNCEANPNSRDAIVILDNKRESIQEHFAAFLRVNGNICLVCGTELLAQQRQDVANYE
jgi:hypothetical protein